MIDYGKVEYAIRITDLIKKDERFDKFDGYMSLFDNGREQGFQIKYYSEDYKSQFIIAFCEHKSSDDIVVYNDHMEHPYEYKYTGRFWGTAVHFRFDLFDEAVEYIYSVMKEDHKKKKRDSEVWYGKDVRIKKEFEHFYKDEKYDRYVVSFLEDEGVVGIAPYYFDKDYRNLILSTNKHKLLISTEHIELI
jgi:hypothetical protein